MNTEAIKKEWEERYFEVLQKCRQDFLESNGFGGLSPINKVTSFDPLLSFIASLLADREKELVEEIEKLRPDTCNCVGAEFECEHWGRHEVIDEILAIIKRK